MPWFIHLYIWCPTLILCPRLSRFSQKVPCLRQPGQLITLHSNLFFLHPPIQITSVILEISRCMILKKSSSFADFIFFIFRIEIIITYLFMVLLQKKGSVTGSILLPRNRVKPFLLWSLMLFCTTGRLLFPLPDRK